MRARRRFDAAKAQRNPTCRLAPGHGFQRPPMRWLALLFGAPSSTRVRL
jgi:hypothetical protein